MSAVSVVHNYLENDPDLLFRVAAANYTLSMEQIAAVLMQIKDQSEVGHLVTRKQLSDAGMDPEMCDRYIIPLKGGDKLIYLYDIPSNLLYEVFPSFKNLCILMKNGGKFDRLLSAFSKCTTYRIMQTRIESEDGAPVFMRDDKVCLAPDADMLDTVRGLLSIALDVLGERKSSKAALAAAKKTFSILSGTYEMVNLDPLYDISPAEQYDAVKEGLMMILRVMHWIFPTLTLNAVIGLKKFYAPDKDIPDILSDIAEYDEDTYDFLEQCSSKMKRLLDYVRAERIRYTPPIQM